MLSSPKSSLANSSSKISPTNYIVWRTYYSQKKNSKNSLNTKFCLYFLNPKLKLKISVFISTNRNRTALKLNWNFGYGSVGFNQFFRFLNFLHTTSQVFCTPLANKLLFFSLLFLEQRIQTPSNLEGRLTANQINPCICHIKQNCMYYAMNGLFLVEASSSS